MLEKMQRNLFEHKSHNLAVLAFLFKIIKGNSCFTYLKCVLSKIIYNRNEEECSLLVMDPFSIVRLNAALSYAASKHIVLD